MKEKNEELLPDDSLCYAISLFSLLSRIPLFCYGIHTFSPFRIVRIYLSVSISDYPFSSAILVIAT